MDINEAKMKSKNFDISPIEYNIGVINNLFLSYYQNLSLFSESLGLCSVSLKDKIDKTKTTINEIKSNYNKDKSKFEEKYSTFDTINKEMSAMYFDQEKNINLIINYIFPNIYHILKSELVILEKKEKINQEDYAELFKKCYKLINETLILSQKTKKIKYCKKI